MLPCSTKSIDNVLITTYKNAKRKKKEKLKYCRNNCNFQKEYFIKTHVTFCFAQKACFESNLLQT